MADLPNVRRQADLVTRRIFMNRTRNANDSVWAIADLMPRIEKLRAIIPVRGEDQDSAELGDMLLNLQLAQNAMTRLYFKYRREAPEWLDTVDRGQAIIGELDLLVNRGSLAFAPPHDEAEQRPQ